MIAKSILAALLALGMAASAQAAMVAPPVQKGAAVTLVAEGCGPGWWRGPAGHCHPMAVGRVCPRGYHLGPEGHRCWPN
jgi:opacity protein-like surface antigen